MKHFKLFFTLITVLTANQIFAQLDNNNGGNTKGKSIGTFEAPVKTITKPKTIGFGNNTGFKTANKEEQKKQQKKEDERKLKNKGIKNDAQVAKERFSKNFKKINGRYAVIDQNLGSFRSNGKFITVYCRDYQHPDNDRVTVYHNNVPVVFNIVLRQSYQSFKIPLEVGINTIDFKALNQGTSGPNTAGFKVYDDSGNLISSNQWELATGAKATIAISKTE
ncbi:hypothetical protein [Tenacibaculum aquimarinum]|uniref:hypothetical protein n=1 Tax=Tenacibaculum aquimarinum TaxID=2910675 RepID=UPI001F0AEF1E|nr:hypothetical protein [Tenacibaculum aquimarinum]MCH3884680.1 hypothetical protein [Tenacibaculum aquimarinum]